MSTLNNLSKSWIWISVCQDFAKLEKNQQRNTKLLRREVDEKTKCKLDKILKQKKLPIYINLF